MTGPIAVKYLCPLEVSIRMLLFPLLQCLRKLKKKRKKKEQDRAARRFYGVERKPKAPQRALGCLMMVSPAPRGPFAFAGRAAVADAPLFAEAICSEGGNLEETIFYSVANREFITKG